MIRCLTRETENNAMTPSTATEGLILSTMAATDLSPEGRAEIIALCTAAYEEDFTDMFDVLPGSVHLLARLDGRLVSHAAWVTRWLQPEGLPVLRTAFVEAVATAPEHQGKGFASAVLRELAARITDYELGALSPSDAAFYERLGWELWRGPLGIRTDLAIMPTPGEEAMILRLPKTPPLDLDRGMTAEWRVGELW